MRTVSDVAASPPAWHVRVDVDAEYAELCHIGNMEFARIFQRARSEFNSLLIARMAGEEHFSDQVIGHISMDFAIELFWTPQLAVHVRVSRIGRSSYELELSIWKEGRIAVVSRTVNIWLKNGAPSPINEEARALLGSFA